MMGVSWGALAGAFLAPFLYGLYSKKTTRAAVWTSFVFGALLMLVQLCASMGLLHFDGVILGFIFKNSLYSGVFAMLGGLIIVPVVSAFTKKSRPENTEEIFSCYNTKITVNAINSLEDK